MSRRQALWLLVAAAAVAWPGTVLAQPAATAETAQAAATPDVSSAVVLEPPASGTVPVPAAVVGPLTPEATTIELLTSQRSCGSSPVEPTVAAVQVVESDEEVLLRVDAAAGPGGAACATASPVRAPVELAMPLGDRVLIDTATGTRRSPPVNRVDPIDTGLRYSCGGAEAPIATMVGPGLDVADHGPTPDISDARAIVDTGDVIEFIGPLRPAGGADWEAWWFGDGHWEQVGSGRCRPRAVLSPGLAGATWSLRGRPPGPEAQRIRVNVRELACASGRAPRGRVAGPIVTTTPEAVVITLGVEPLPGPQDCQGAPAAPYVVRLPEPLGDRALYDGGVYPPQEQRARGR